MEMSIALKKRSQQDQNGTLFLGVFPWHENKHVDRNTSLDELDLEYAGVPGVISIERMRVKHFCFN